MTGRDDEIRATLLRHLGGPPVDTDAAWDHLQPQLRHRQPRQRVRGLAIAAVLLGVFALAVPLLATVLHLGPREATAPASDPPAVDPEALNAATSCEELADATYRQLARIVTYLNDQPVAAVLPSLDDGTRSSSGIRPLGAQRLLDNGVKPAIDRLGCASGRSRLPQLTARTDELQAAARSAAAQLYVGALFLSADDAARTNGLLTGLRLLAATQIGYHDDTGNYADRLSQLPDQSVAMQEIPAALDIEIVFGNDDSFCIAARTPGLPKLYYRHPEDRVTATPCRAS